MNTTTISFGSYYKQSKSIVFGNQTNTIRVSLYSSTRGRLLYGELRWGFVYFQFQFPPTFWQKKLYFLIFFPFIVLVTLQEHSQVTSL